MKFDNETRTRITITVTTDFDPGDATIELWLADAWHPCTWIAAATTTTTKDGPRWTRRARTDGYFAGSEAAASDPADVVLAGASRQTQTRVVSGGDEIVAPSTPIDVE